MVYKIKAKKNNTKKRNKKSIRRKLRRNKTKKNKKSIRRRKRGGYDYNKPTINDRVSGFLSKITPTSSDKYDERTTNQENNIIYDNKVHMQSLYGNAEITSQCDTPQQCRCISKERRVQDLINMLENRGICTECERECPRTQKILENYKKLLNEDLQSLPFTHFRIRRSRFPAYYKGYMTPSRIIKLIQNRINNGIYTPDTEFEVSTEIYVGYDKYGNTLSRCHHIFRGDRAPEFINNCNKIIDEINKKNKELDKKSGNTKKYILFKKELFLIDKNIFTTKYRPEIIDMEI